MDFEIEWKPKDGLRGNANGTLKWQSNFNYIILFDPVEGTYEVPTEPNGNASKVINGLGQPNKNGTIRRIVYASDTPEGTEDLQYIFPFSISVTAAPLLSARWEPKKPWDTSQGLKNYEGNLILQTAGADEVTVDGKKINSVSGTIDYQVKPKKALRSGTFVVAATKTLPNNKKKTVKVTVKWTV
jgi:hypothetical protein